MSVSLKILSSFFVILVIYGVLLVVVFGMTTEYQIAVESLPPITTREARNSHALKIYIVIPTTFTEKDANLRKWQRLSWINYLDQSNPLWSDMHSQCEITYDYYVGMSDNDAENLKIKDESVMYKDMIQMNFSEAWHNLQAKTIDVVHLAYLKHEKNNAFDLMLKTDTDSFVNAPNLCNAMIKFMNVSGWNGKTKALYLGDYRHNAGIQNGGKYGNIQWKERVKQEKYLPFMAGFGYVMSYKTVQIIYDSLEKAKDDLAFNRLEDTWLGHYLTSFDVEYVAINHAIVAHPHPTVQSLNNHVVDHWYTGEKMRQMLEKYELHCKLHRKYLNAQNRTDYNPTLVVDAFLNTYQKLQENKK